MNESALLLATTLLTAASIFKDASTEGLKQAGQGEKAKSSRNGEAFATEFRFSWKIFMEDDKAF